MNQLILKLCTEIRRVNKALNVRYVDDPRNTDNAWMETVAFNFHDESGDKVPIFTSFLTLRKNKLEFLASLYNPIEGLRVRLQPI